MSLGQKLRALVYDGEQGIKDGRYDWTSPEGWSISDGSLGSGENCIHVGETQASYPGPNVFYWSLQPQHPAPSLASSTELEPMLYKELSCPTYFFCFILNCYPPCLPSSNQLDGSDVFPNPPAPSTSDLYAYRVICLVSTKPPTLFYFLSSTHHSKFLL